MNEISPRLDGNHFVFQNGPPKLSPIKSSNNSNNAFNHNLPVSKICQYRTGKCQFLRATKPNGYLHKLCDMHRSKANENQRRLDRKKKAQGFNRRERVSCSSKRKRGLQTEQLGAITTTESTTTNTSNVTGTTNKTTTTTTTATSTTGSATSFPMLDTIPHRSSPYQSNKPAGLHVCTNSLNKDIFMECPPPPPPTKKASYQPFPFPIESDTNDMNDSNCMHNSGGSMEWLKASSIEPHTANTRQIQELDAAFDESMIPYLFEQLFELEKHSMAS